MKLTLKRLDNLSGEKASIYTVIMDQQYLFGSFLEENLNRKELPEMLQRIKSMGETNSASMTFFKEGESSNPKDKKVVAFYDKPELNIRVYCVWMSEKLVVFGGGGPKPKWIRTWQQSKKLKKEAEMIMRISELIDVRMNSRELTISPDGFYFQGKLELLNK